MIRQMKLQSLAPWATALAALLTAAGCTVGPNYRPPQTPMPAAYGSTTQPTSLATSQPAAAATQPISVDTTQWWRTFSDPALDRLVDQALKANLDLRQAEARVREARALRRIAGSNYYPTVDASGQYTRSKGSKNLGSRGVSVGPGGAATLGQETDLWQAGFDASWEIDVFGGIRRGVEAAEADLAATIADRNNVIVSLLGEVGRNYMELRGFQRRIAIARENVTSQSESLDLTRAKFRAGLSNDLDVAQAEAQVATTESQIPALETSAQQVAHALAVLVGQTPESLVDELGQPAPLPAPPPGVPLGLPSELLRRRPDIMSAERQLAAATARIGVETADLFPRFTLSGSLGQQSTKFARLADGNSTFWSIGPDVSLPIFNAGRLRAAVDVEKARTDQALANYERTVLQALADVEDALVAFEKEQTRRAILVQAVQSNRRAVNLSEQLYQRGLAPFLNVLDAQRALYVVEDQLVQSDITVSSSAVALFKALGGGWEEPTHPQ
jgi:NodT family efflux transporter outer membrane factor (OMF) lipoprotein